MIKKNIIIQLTIILLGVILIFLSVTKSSAIEFTEMEKKWLENKPTLRFSEVNWKPLSDIDSFPVYKGIIADYLKIISDRSGVKMDFVKSNTWHEVLTKFKNNEIDLIPALSVEDDIGVDFLYTDSYISFPLVIATRKDVDFIGYTHELNKKKVGVGKGYTSYFFLKNNYPSIILVTSDDVPQGLELLNEGKIDAFVGHLAVVTSAINNSHYDVKIAGKTEYNFEHRIGLNIKNKEAVSIFNKIFNEITLDDHNLIYNKWIKINEAKTDYTILIKSALVITVIFSIFFCFIAYRYYLLNKVNMKLIHMANTDDLTQCANRKRINKEIELAEYNWKRYEIPFSLILIDLDNFKSINDYFGHCTGDKVLKDFAIMLKKNARKSDIVGRWGGEEFLIICPNTCIEGVENNAKKLLQLINDRQFPDVKKMTASFGIAQLSEDESLKDFFIRIDKALYKAKKNGKNQIERG